LTDDRAAQVTDLPGGVRTVPAGRPAQVQAQQHVHRQPDDDIHYLYKDKDCMILEPNDPAGVLIRTGVNPNLKAYIYNNGLLSLREVKRRDLSTETSRSYLDDVIFFRPPNLYPAGENGWQTIADLFRTPIVEDLFRPPLYFYLNVHPGHTNVFYQEYHANLGKDNPDELFTKLADLLKILAKRPGNDLGEFQAHWTVPLYRAQWLRVPEPESSNMSQVRDLPGGVRSTVLPFGKRAPMMIIRRSPLWEDEDDDDNRVERMNLELMFEVRVRLEVIPFEWLVKMTEGSQAARRSRTPAIMMSTRKGST
jgi:hypothetical protein